jgi:hypothetical protein
MGRSSAYSGTDGRLSVSELSVCRHWEFPPMRNPQIDYEFDQAQNAVFGRLSSAMVFVGTYDVYSGGTA